MADPVDVVTLGEALIGLIADDGAPLPIADRFGRTVVGAESNVAIGLARLDHSVRFIGRVGADAYGHTVRRTLRGEGIDLTALGVDDTRPTGLLVRDACVGRPLTVMYHRTGSAGAALTPDDVAGAGIESARLLHVTGLTAALSESARDTVRTAIRLARSAGVHVCLDPNVRLRLAAPDHWRALLAELSAEADTVLVGADELEYTGSPEELQGRGVRHVIVKLGAAGATEYDTDGSRTQPARPVPVIDPVGAGDAFAAGWISGWLDGLDSHERLQRGTAVASCVVACRGDIDGLPDRAMLQSLGDGAVDVIR